ncbi:TetR family transcriptional regulator C-terminal domain-containing protein (plasmid) [Rhizobium sp. CB3171]|uniref:TetR/AcrR family transcriptional regulator n=1 Tax=unclassified Rhizobium TaxID=2613769 RepID=UPI00131A5566|nr:MULTISPECIES: TetR family transcriptional regulator C-terminal domain-containing protein [Rhizobium]UWU24172.1 TetR family transcriptional regulator C-terminal domain-containing protein [Rhizobium tropici]WFU05101.1 TetR family transcriptional regulator C-terminal domain-containing protein [Rhizobium sp. CB3171]
MLQKKTNAKPQDGDPIKRIVDAVCEVIADEGVANVSMRKVADKAGATIGLITHHFPNRAAMVQAAVEHAWDMAKKEIRWPTTLDRNEITASLEAFLPLDPSRRRQLSVWLAFWALTQTSPELQTIHRNIHTFMRDKHVKWIRLLGHSLKDARRIADALLVQCDGILVYALLDEKYWTPEHQRLIVAEAVDKVLSRTGSS